MGRVFVIARREVSSLFYSPIAYFVLFLFTFVTGFFFAATIFIPGQLTEIRGLVSFSRYSLFFIVPGITMALMADEYRSGRIEMLRTSPLTELDLLLGKYLGALMFYILVVACTLVYVLLLLVWGRPDWGQLIACYVGLLLMGMMYVAVGLFFSTCTQNQIVAYLSTLLVLGFLALAGDLSTLVPAKLFGWDITFARPTMAYLGVYNHIADFAKGVVDTAHVGYFLGFSVLFLFFTYLILESRKWR